jgi:flagellar secretion chaperone FliS
MTTRTLHNRYVTDTVATVSPARLVTMLYDSLVNDLVRAEQALGGTDRQEVNERLLHAQAIVTELRVSLDVSAWEGGPALAGLYDFVLRELIDANVNRDAAKVAACRELVEPLRDAWHQAATQVAVDR